MIHERQRHVHLSHMSSRFHCNDSPSCIEDRAALATSALVHQRARPPNQSAICAPCRTLRATTTTMPKRSHFSPHTFLRTRTCAHCVGTTATQVIYDHTLCTSTTRRRLPAALNDELLTHVTRRFDTVQTHSIIVSLHTRHTPPPFDQLLVCRCRNRSDQRAIFAAL